jgi:catechol 2,3-dioxygenase-like lactoylglutathione lyase family enzyme
MRAFHRLSAIAGWTAISTAGPQRLPVSSGVDIAFKFREPEGHPLELLEFPHATPSNQLGATPDDTCVGIDHSAIRVADGAASIIFYQSLGLSVSARTFNHGPEQQKLDDLPDAQVEVIALAPRCPAPHLELLCYRTAPKRPTLTRGSNDIASTYLVFELCGPSNAIDGDMRMRSMRDPDDHAFLIV